MKTKELAEQILLEVEVLEERIAPGLTLESCVTDTTVLTSTCIDTATATCVPTDGSEPEPEPKPEPEPTPEPTDDGNNGWGNGEDAAPGSSAEAQPGFEDPYTGESPSSSTESADGDR